MKKLLVLFVLAGLVFSTTSCKKEDCPECEEPVLHGVGTWNASKVIVQNQDVTNSGDPEVMCWLNEVIVLDKSQNGTSWDLYMYDSNTSTCNSLNLQVTSWAENYSKQKLYVTITYQGDEYNFTFNFVNDSQIMMSWGAPGELDIYYDKQ